MRISFFRKMETDSAERSRGCLSLNSNRRVSSMENWKDRIMINPNISHGRPCIKGTRVWVSLIVDNFAAGSSEDEILKAYPSLTREDIHAALAFAAEMSRERYVDVPLERAK
jgi:uncharacterized protein (DUF433 family)